MFFINCISQKDNRNIKCKTYSPEPYVGGFVFKIVETTSLQSNHCSAITCLGGAIIECTVTI